LADIAAATAATGRWRLHPEAGRRRRRPGAAVVEAAVAAVVIAAVAVHWFVIVVHFSPALLQLGAIRAGHESVDCPM
jgi:hypothetical protein